MKSTLVFTCSYASFKTQDGSPFSARTYDGSTLKGIHHKSTERGKDCGNSTASKYNFQSVIDVANNITLDGLNSNGLSVSSLGQKRTVYQTVPEGKQEQALSIHDLGSYILGTCANVEEVQNTLENAYVTAEENAPLLNFSFCDAQGKQLFVEYVDGKPEFRSVEGKPGILTEDFEPSWAEQEAKQLDAKDPTSEVRYQRLVQAFKELKTPEKSTKGEDFAFDLMGRVTIYEGEWKVSHGDVTYNCFTQYTVVMDHKNQNLYYTHDSNRHWSKRHTFDIKTGHHNLYF